MYNLNDTIVAVSSPSSDGRVLIRMTGPATMEKLSEIFEPASALTRHGIVRGKVAADEHLQLEALVYLFFAPRSYTGDDLAELHILSNPAVTEALLERFFSDGLRMAGPGEFTARAYLNGKMDLARAEAVNEVIVSSNRYQLAAAQTVLAGRLTETAKKVCEDLLDCLSLLEAGLDFSDQDIEFISRPEAVERLERAKAELQRLLSGSISYEEVVDLPAVGIAGAPNAGKSSLLNRLLGAERSIVSQQRKTTRDVVTAVVTLKHSRAVLFDCAGLVVRPSGVLDELAQAAAVEAIARASAVLFCVDLSKADFGEDLAVRRLIEAECLIGVATKADLVDGAELPARLAEFKRLFALEFLPTSAKTGMGIDKLNRAIDEALTGALVGAARQGGVAAALTARHKQAVTEAVASIEEAVSEVMTGNDEVAAVLLRSACHWLGQIERQDIDERILERIFSRFCIGK